MMDTISMVVVDDHPIFREGLAAILATEPDIEVVGQGGSAEDAIQLAHTLLPDVILLDIEMPGGGLNAAQRITAELPVVKIIMLTVFEDEDHVLAAFRSGAQAYVLKGVGASELIAVIHVVQAGEGYVTPTLAASLLSVMTSPVPREPPHGTALDELTDRERQILEIIAVGATNREIGQQLHLTEKTVKHYITNLLQKLQVRNRVEAVLVAQRASGRIN